MLRIGRSLGKALQPGSAALWAGALFLLLFAVLALQPIQPADFWWQLRVGQVVLQEGRVPTTDLFSYTVPGAPFFYQSWLAGVLFALVYALGGPALIVVMNAVMLTAAYALLWRACRLASEHAHVATGCTLAAIVVSLGNWGVRPQSFSTLLVAAFILILVRFRRGLTGPLWLLPLLTALWANLHGAFILGPALVGATMLGEALKVVLPGRPFPPIEGRRLRNLGLATLGTLAAPLLNPAGLHIVAYLRDIGGNPVIRQSIAEWKPPRPDDAVGAVFYLSLLGLFFLLLYLRVRPDPVDALWLAGTSWLALGGVRSILWYSFVMALLLAGALSSRPRPQPAQALEWQIGVNRAFLAILAGIALLSMPWSKSILPLPADMQGAISRDTPVHAADEIESAGLEGPIFHRMEYGGYLLWRFYPQRRVFIDPRIELYPTALWSDYALISSGAPEAGALLDRYGVRVLLLDTRTQAGLVEWASASGEWEVRFVDPAEESIVLTRKLPADGLTGGPAQND